MAVVYAPVLAIMRIVDELGRPSVSYPWGLHHPGFSIAVLVVSARLVTLAIALWLAATVMKASRGPGATAWPGEPDVGPWWLPLVLLAGSPTFVYYTRTSNADMYSLAWAWIAIMLATRAQVSQRVLILAGVAAALAVCSKEETAPMALVAGLAACARAWGLRDGERSGGLRAAAIVALAAVLAYSVVWLLPFNRSGWLAHHRFIFFAARYPRSFSATAEGCARLGLRCLEVAPVALGWPVISPGSDPHCAPGW
jgi:hypothetical protein